MWTISAMRSFRWGPIAGQLPRLTPTVVRGIRFSERVPACSLRSRKSDGSFGVRGSLTSASDTAPLADRLLSDARFAARECRMVGGERTGSFSAETTDNGLMDGAERPIAMDAE
jgi:hypothetical protein